MERKISVELYVIAFVLSAIIFAAGVYVGFLINKGAVESINSNMETLNSKIATATLLFFLDEENQNFCKVYENELSLIDQEREKVGYELSLMEDQKKYFSPEAKRNYMILQLQSLLFSKKVNKLCEGKNYSFVLYFYNNTNCDVCRAQGDNILRARDALPENERAKIRIYAFDSGVGSDVVAVLMTQYGVRSIPTTIIGNASYAGLLSVDEIKKAMENAG